MHSELNNVAEHDIPPAPWHLHGAACVSLWRVPAELLPVPSAGVSYANVAGQALVVTAWVRYEPGGTLSYDELAAAVLVRGAGLFSPACTIPHIWVNDPVAAAGGRRLWAIPKDLAEFEGGLSLSGAAPTVRATTTGSPLASLMMARRFALPGRLPLRGFLIQGGVGGPVRTRCAARGKVWFGQATWEFSSSGPLAFLRGRKPLLSMQVNELQGHFGL